MKLINLVRRTKWHIGVRSGDTPLVYSLRCEGEEKYIKKLYGKKFSQWRMLIPKDKSNVRAIGITQAKKFHSTSAKIIVKNPEILNKKILEDKKLLAEIIDKSKNIKNTGDVLTFLDLLEKHYFLFFLCFSYGMKLFENKGRIKDKRLMSEVLKIHDDWRNSVFTKEMKALDNLDDFMKSLAKKRGLKNFEDFFYLEVNEFKKILNKNLNKNDKEKIKKRKKEFVYFFINGRSKIAEDVKTTKEIRELFREKKCFSSKEIRGMVTYRNTNKIRGVVKIVKNPKLKTKGSKNTILIALQTNPSYISIVKNFSAIITDEGGITCHAAILSREFKIPCIVGTQNATKVLKNGDLIEMDMKNGKVKILKQTPS